MTASYPLQWPEGWARTRRRERSKFACTFVAARDGVVRELSLMGNARSIVVSTNLATRLDGLPYANLAQPKDPGVSVYWYMNGKTQVMACDRWDRVKDNLRAIEKTLDALRGISRWGSTDITNKAFSGFAALPSPSTGWREVMKFGSCEPVSRQKLRSRFKSLAIGRHPDRGGSDALMSELNEAYRLAEIEVG